MNNAVLRIANMLIMLFLSFYVLIEVFSLSDFLLNQRDYIFGTEVHGWKYRSEGYFIFSSLLGLLLTLSGIYFSVRLSDPYKKLIVRTLVLMLVVLIFLYQG